MLLNARGSVYAFILLPRKMYLNQPSVYYSYSCIPQHSQDSHMHQCTRLRPPSLTVRLPEYASFGLFEDVNLRLESKAVAPKVRQTNAACSPRNT